MAKRKILYAEDEEDVRDVYLTMIESEFPQVVVHAVTDGQEAMDYISKEMDYTVVISDYSMPNKNGGELYQFLKSNKMNVPYILLSGVDIGDDSNLSGFLGDNPENCHLEKPVTQHVLTEKLTKALDASAGMDPWLAVRIDNFLNCKMVPCDVFIKLSKIKYVKLIRKEIEYNPEGIKKYMAKGIKNLYVESDKIPLLKESINNFME